jgi:hypothetical protein
MKTAISFFRLCPGVVITYTPAAVAVYLALIPVDAV